MKTPISYYGGKQNLVSELLPLIPKHTQYVEPFVGGETLFFAKKPSDHEVINDYDGLLINFWEVLKGDFENLQALIQGTLHSELLYKRAKDILKNPDDHEPLIKAWAYWVNTQMGFSFKLFGGFAFENTSGRALLAKNKKDNFTSKLYERLKIVEIFNRDAIDIIKRKDSKTTFFYLDPPYAESDCGTYNKTKNVYYDVLNLLPEIEGKFLLSSYPSEQLTEIRKNNGFNFKDIQQNLSVSGKHTLGKVKTECLTWNYQVENSQSELFK